MRIALYVLLGWVTLLLWTVLAHAFGWSMLRPDPAFVLVTLLGLSGETLAAVAATLVLGWIMDVESATPTGLHMFTLMAQLLFVGVVGSRVVVLGSRASVLVLVGACTFGYLPLVLFMLSSVREVGHLWTQLLPLLPITALLNVATAAVLLPLTKRIDARFLDDQRVRL